MQKEITQEKSGDESSNGGHCHRGLERVKPFKLNPRKIEKFFHQFHFLQGHTKMRTEEK